MLTRNRGLSRNYFQLRRKAAAPPPKDSFFFRVFNANIEVANNVLNTPYLQTMLAGNLLPDNYGQLTVQDAYYCYRGADTYNTALCMVDKSADPELYTLMSELHQSYREYNEIFFNDWRIRTSESVNPSQNFVDYSEHEHHIACSKDPIYTLISMLPCYYLWYWFSDQMLQKGMNDANLYKGWVEGCHSADSAYEIGSFIDSWQKDGKAFDESLATEIYTKSMNYELAVFTAALERKGN